ncbi:GtrA family protein [Agathobaculum hominis]|jgi:putative flippase GtrA|uniref:GtrA family protein n=1 Tax=Agathobaculum hominis TaxID=2763014 RepID=A0ABR7GMZ8_9FIRM|nr:GtrA family protein [Agathobaculum hominis]MBC5695695.1 GtrA family protein [Agathobaculum hominis]RHS84725.1 GtrA family protein [Butyricicoccus sp. AM42-5AC]
MKEKIIQNTVLRFILVGVINTLVGTAIMFGLYNLAHCSYWVSSASNYILTSILSFFLNKFFTFQNKEKSIGQVVRFAVNIAVCYLLAYGIAKPLCLYLLSGVVTSVRDNVSMFVGMCLFTAFNYCGQRFFAFKKRKG